MEIDENIIKKASKCEKHFACLNNYDHKCCQINICVNNEICYLRNEKKKDCYYNESYGFTNRCTCPVRIEIYRKNKN